MSDKRGSKGLTAEQVIEALRDTNGNMSLAARRLKVTRAAIAYYVREYPTVRAAHDEAAAYVSDIAEGHLVSAVIKGNLEQARYWLENKARDRGYGRGPAMDPAMNITADQLAGMTDEELDLFIAKLDRLTRKG